MPPCCSQLSKSMITPSHRPDATALTGQADPTHGQTKRLCTTAQKSGTRLRVGCPAMPRDLAGRKVKSQVQRHANTYPRVSHHPLPNSSRCEPQESMGQTHRLSGPKSTWNLNFFWHITSIIIINQELLSYLRFSAIHEVLSS